MRRAVDVKFGETPWPDIPPPPHRRRRTLGRSCEMSSRAAIVQDYRVCSGGFSFHRSTLFESLGNYVVAREYVVHGGSDGQRLGHR